MTNMHGRGLRASRRPAIQRLHAFAAVAVAAIALHGCTEDPEKPAPLPRDTLGGAWVGTWTVRTTVNWIGTGECPSDTAMITTIGIFDGDPIEEVLEGILPEQMASYVPYMEDCPTDADGNAIEFSCSAAVSAGGCFASLSGSGTGSVTEATFSILMSGDLNVQGAAACVPRSCGFDVVADATRVTAMPPAALAASAPRRAAVGAAGGMRYN